MLSSSLEALRRKANITYKDLAASCNLSEQTVYRACKGETVDPGFSVVAGIAKTCGGSLDEIAGIARSGDDQRVADLKEIISAQAQAAIQMEAANRQTVKFTLIITAALMVAQAILDVILLTAI